MLKKAKSFREKFKRGAINRASASTSALRATLARNLSITGRDRKRGEDRTPDKQSDGEKASSGSNRPTQLCPDGKTLELLTAEPVHPNVRKVQNERKKVTQALKYINFAIDKSNMILLPGSATVALETTFELITLITGLLSTEDPSAELTYYLTQTYSSLAELIEWADQVMLMDIKSQLDTANAKRVIRGIETSVDELAEFTCEIVKHLKVQVTPTNNYTMTLPSKSRQRRAAALNNNEDRTKRNSMPEVPLTPREKTILRETSLGAFDNPLALEKADVTSPTSPSALTQAINDDLDTPPPKPYLPPNFNLQRTLSRSPSSDLPPPDLPTKQSKKGTLKRAKAVISSTDSLDGHTTAASGVSRSDEYTRPRSAVITSSAHLTRFDSSSVRSANSSTGQLCSSHDSIDGSLSVVIHPAGKRSSIISNSSQSSTGASTVTGGRRYNIVTGADGRSYIQAPPPDDLSPIQPILQSAGAPAATSAAAGYMGAPVDLNDLSSRIDHLAMGFIANSAGHKGTTPNLSHPASRKRLGSDYDNISNTSCSFDSTSSPAVTPVMAASDSWTPSGDRNLMNRSYAGLPSVTQWHQQQSTRFFFEESFSQQHIQMSGHAYLSSRAAAATQHQDMLRHASSVSIHSADTASAAASVTSLRVITDNITLTSTTAQQNRLSASSSQFQPPPLPPKRKHVESYMHVFGTETELPEFNPVESLSSRRFYLHMQEQHQLELFEHQALLMHNGAGVGGYVYHPYHAEHECMDPNHNMRQEHHGEGAHGAVGFRIPEVEGGESPVPSSHRSSLDLSDTEDAEYAELNPLDMIDVRDLLIRESETSSSTSADSAVGSMSTSSYGSKTTLQGSSKGTSKIMTSGLKGGTVDALVVYATHVGKHDITAAGSFLSLANADLDSDFMYQEAFLTTYRTFISPEELIDKLLYRYNKFAHSADVSKKRLSRNAFSLLVRVVDELTSSELKDAVSLRLLKLVTELVREGELTLAKIMRRKVLEKCDPNQRPKEELQIMASSSGPKSPSRGMTLLDFKSHEIAEQLTLIENDFYQRLELPELLTWSQEQNEEKCPNLVEFTEHFNKMSWWCRFMILKPDDPAVRDKYFIKFVHILKHLRKHNNFNSLLALLSALDSAPVSRLDWPKQEKEMISEYFHLIDCTSSFKSYRIALSDAEPPCIPYIGLILNDMTIIRVGNTSNLKDGNINFQMRWHLFNVLECLRRFRKPLYPFKKDPKILQFVDDFAEHNSNDDEMWERSKEIKPSANR